VLDTRAGSGLSEIPEVRVELKFPDFFYYKNINECCDFKKIGLFLRHFKYAFAKATEDKSAFTKVSADKSAFTKVSADKAGCSAARLAHLVWDQRVAGSNPATPTLRMRELQKIVTLFFLLFTYDLHTLQFYAEL
jgi:hypothetical protein